MTLKEFKKTMIYQILPKKWKSNPEALNYLKIAYLEGKYSNDKKLIKTDE